MTMRRGPLNYPASTPRAPHLRSPAPNPPCTAPSEVPWRTTPTHAITTCASRVVRSFLFTNSYPSPLPLTFPQSRRLTHNLEFAAVYGARMKKSAGPLTGYSMPNGRGHYRLGLAVRKHSTAVERSRVKRMVREAFRLSQGALPMAAGGGGSGSGGYDLIIAAREHEPLALTEYQRLFQDVAGQLHQAWEKRQRRGRPEDGSAGP